MRSSPLIHDNNFGFLKLDYTTQTLHVELRAAGGQGKAPGHRLLTERFQFSELLSPNGNSSLGGFPGRQCWAVSVPPSGCA